MQIALITSPTTEVLILINASSFILRDQFLLGFGCLIDECIRIYSLLRHILPAPSFKII